MTGQVNHKENWFSKFDPSNYTDYKGLSHAKKGLVVATAIFVTIFTFGLMTECALTSLLGGRIQTKEKLSAKPAEVANNVNDAVNRPLPQQPTATLSGPSTGPNADSQGVPPSSTSSVEHWIEGKSNEGLDSHSETHKAVNELNLFESQVGTTGPGAFGSTKVDVPEVVAVESIEMPSTKENSPQAPRTLTKIDKSKPIHKQEIIVGMNPFASDDQIEIANPTPIVDERVQKEVVPEVMHVPVHSSTTVQPEIPIGDNRFNNMFAAEELVEASNQNQAEASKIISISSEMISLREEEATFPDNLLNTPEDEPSALQPYEESTSNSEMPELANMPGQVAVVEQTTSQEVEPEYRAPTAVTNSSNSLVEMVTNNQVDESQNSESADPSSKGAEEELNEQPALHSQEGKNEIAQTTRANSSAKILGEPIDDGQQEQNTSMPETSEAEVITEQTTVTEPSESETAEPIIEQNSKPPVQEELSKKTQVFVGDHKTIRETEIKAASVQASPVWVQNQALRDQIFKPAPKPTSAKSVAQPQVAAQPVSKPTGQSKSSPRTSPNPQKSRKTTPKGGWQVVGSPKFGGKRKEEALKLTSAVQVTPVAEEEVITSQSAPAQEEVMTPEAIRVRDLTGDWVEAYKRASRLPGFDLETFAKKMSKKLREDASLGREDRKAIIRAVRAANAQMFARMEEVSKAEDSIPLQIENMLKIVRATKLQNPDDTQRIVTQFLDVCRAVRPEEMCWELKEQIEKAIQEGFLKSEVAQNLNEGQKGSLQAFLETLNSVWSKHPSVVSE